MKKLVIFYIICFIPFVLSILLFFCGLFTNNKSFVESGLLLALAFYNISIIPRCLIDDENDNKKNG